MRLQLAWPGLTVVPAETFNRLFTLHGTTMIFLVGVPIVFGFGNYLVPLMIGARDLAFRRLNAFGFWVMRLPTMAAGLAEPHQPCARAEYGRTLR